MENKETLYRYKLFMNAVLPLVRVMAESKTALGKSFRGKNAVIRVSVATGEGKDGVRFVIQDGQWSVAKGPGEAEGPAPDLELAFRSVQAFNDFFSGRSKKLPGIKGWHRPGLLLGFLRVLMAMADLLGAKTPPQKEEDKALMVKLFFYLLSSGISQLNKAGHPAVSGWAQKSPDRVYAWAVDGHPELSAYIRVKAGNSKAARGEYTRSRPFFTMRFNSVDSALGILLETDNLIEATVEGRIVMEGAPEYGAMIGEFMLLVGTYAK